MMYVSFGSAKDIEAVRSTEVDSAFMAQLKNTKLVYHCENSMIMSYYHYGPVNDYVARKAPTEFDNAMSAYKETGNAEHLVDAVNYLMIRQMFYPNEEKKCLDKAKEIDAIYNESNYKPTDEGGSTNSLRQTETTWTALMRGHFVSKYW